MESVDRARELFKKEVDKLSALQEKMGDSGENKWVQENIQRMREGSDFNITYLANRFHREAVSMMAGPYVRMYLETMQEIYEKMNFIRHSVEGLAVISGKVLHARPIGAFHTGAIMEKIALIERSLEWN